MATDYARLYATTFDQLKEKEKECEQVKKYADKLRKDNEYLQENYDRMASQCDVTSSLEIRCKSDLAAIKKLEAEAELLRVKHRPNEEMLRLMKENEAYKLQSSVQNSSSPKGFSDRLTIAEEKIKALEKEVVSLRKRDDPDPIDDPQYLEGDD